MKKAILATLVGLTQAADSEAISMLMNFGNRGVGQFQRGVPGYAGSRSTAASEAQVSAPDQRTAKP